MEPAAGVCLTAVHLGSTGRLSRPGPTYRWSEEPGPLHVASFAWTSKGPQPSARDPAGTCGPIRDEAGINTWWLRRADSGLARIEKGVMGETWRFSWPCHIFLLGYRTASRLPFTSEALLVCRSSIMMEVPSSLPTTIQASVNSAVHNLEKNRKFVNAV